MVQSRAATVEEYLDELAPDRRDVLARLRAVILEHLPPGYEESMAWGMIGYGIPLARYPDTYNGQPLAYVGLAAQKNYFALYLMGVYGDPLRRRQLEDAFAEHGGRLDMGRSCVRFRRLEELPLEAIGTIIAAIPPEALIRQYEAARK